MGSAPAACALQVASSPNLASLCVINCRLCPEAGAALAEALRASTALSLPLCHLELQGNRLDSGTGQALALALQGNARLHELNVANNPMDAAALAALARAKAEVTKWKQWRSDRDAAAAKAEEKAEAEKTDARKEFVAAAVAAFEEEACARAAEIEAKEEEKRAEAEAAAAAHGEAIHI